MNTMSVAVNPLPLNKLYLGSIGEKYPQVEAGFVGLALVAQHGAEIVHDIREPFPVSDASVDAVQAEDVMEHIAYPDVPKVLDDIWRVLRVGGRFRLSVPDYRSPVLAVRSAYDSDGNVVGDLMMGARLGYDRTTRRMSVTYVQGGFPHLWFPTYELVMEAVLASNLRKCERIEWHHFWRSKTEWFVKPFEEFEMPVKRSPPRDMRARGKPVSIIVDFVK